MKNAIENRILLYTAYSDDGVKQRKFDSSKIRDTARKEKRRGCRRHLFYGAESEMFYMVLLSNI